MRGLHRLNNVAQTAQARMDYAYLLNLAAHHGLEALVPPADMPTRREFDKAAKAGVEAILEAKPELREKLREIYPGLVKEESCL